MPKNTSAKTQPVHVSPKAPKTRLTKSVREILHRFMLDEFRKRIDLDEIRKTREALVKQANGTLRAKYPEEDMPVLRKYDMARIDTCLKFTLLDTQRVFQVQFTPYNVPLSESSGLVDIPCLRGCYNHEIYPCDKGFESLADAFEKQIEQCRRNIAAKEQEYNSFLLACRYLEDVEAVISISEETRKAVGAQSRSLSVVSPDLINRIKSDFSQGVAA